MSPEQISPTGEPLDARTDIYSLRMYLALVATQVGENELALTELEMLSRNPGPLSYGDLKLNPDWDPLRREPRFEALLAFLAPAKK